ncbi:hypothetical protein [Clostridium sp. LP20]|uniref:hypothetical protein n=1 Tax=Clostridium sp. LP20 TaxID=3418665 RepID=UPI003EE74286
MKSIILIGDDSLELSKIQKLELDGCINCSEIFENSLGIELKSGRLYLDYSNDIGLDYEEEELNTIKIEKPKFISIEYSTIDALKILLEALLNCTNLLVDDDKGNIIDIRTYLQGI